MRAAKSSTSLKNSTEHSPVHPGQKSKEEASLEHLTQIGRETREAQEAFLKNSAPLIVAAAQEMGATLRSGGKILILGNGGSAADAQHMAAEMVGRLQIERGALAAIALSTDSSNLTAVGNDYGFQFIFSRQIQALAKPGDVVVAISTSGKSPNVLEAVREAKKIGCFVVGLTGGSGGDLAQESDLCLNVALGKNSSRIQESHIFAIHSLVDLVDRFFLGESTPI